MASEIKQNEEGMSDILQTNDDLIRVIDAYKKTMGIETPPTTGALGLEAAATTATAGPAGVTTGEASDPSGSGDVLIDLAGLNLGPPPSTSGQGDADGGLSDELLLAELGIFGGGRDHIIRTSHLCPSLHNLI